MEPPTWRALDDVVLHVLDAARLEVPPGAAFRFLGRPGDPLWLLPQIQEEGVVWPGWNTQHPQVARDGRREVTWTLHGVRGPGRFALFANDDFGAPRVIFDSGRPFPQETGIDVDTHVHGNWAFARPGTYLLDIAMGATTTDGRAVADRGTLRVFVGAGDPRAAFAAAASAPGRDGSDAPWAWLGAAAGALAAAAAAAVALRRRRPARGAA